MRLIGLNGDQLGVVPTAQALDMAREAQMDLVEVAPLERPPVCKILDYGGMAGLKYAARSAQKVREAEDEIARLVG